MPVNNPAKYLNPQTGKVDLGKYQSTIQEAVKRTRQVLGPETLVGRAGAHPQEAAIAASGLIKTHPKALRYDGFLGPPEEIFDPKQVRADQRLGQAFASSYKQKRDVATAEANRAADALAMRGASSIERIGSLQTMRDKFTSPEAQADFMKKYKEATKLAGTYVDTANVRLSHFMGTMDKLLSEQEGRLERARVQDIESAVYGLEGQLKEQEAAYLAQEGNTSDFETMQAYLGEVRRKQHGVIRSSISPAYTKLEQEFRQAHLAATQAGYTDLSMHISFREQQHVEAKQAEAAAAGKYKLDMMNLDMLVSDSIGREYEDVMNWIVQSPISSVDSLPMMLAIAEYNQAQDDNYSAGMMSNLLASI